MPAKLDERVSKHDREIAAIRKVLATGMRMLARTQSTIDSLAGEHAALAKDMRELAAAQRRTDKRMDRLESVVERFIRSLERGGGNGHGKIDLR